MVLFKRRAISRQKTVMSNKIKTGIKMEKQIESKRSAQTAILGMIVCFAMVFW